MASTGVDDDGRPPYVTHHLLRVACSLLLSTMTLQFAQAQSTRLYRGLRHEPRISLEVMDTGCGSRLKDVLSSMH